LTTTRFPTGIGGAGAAADASCAPQSFPSNNCEGSPVIPVLNGGERADFAHEAGHEEIISGSLHRESYLRKSRMVEISSSESGEGLGRATERGYSIPTCME